MDGSANVTRRGRSGGGAARRAERTAIRIERAAPVRRALPAIDLLTAEAAEAIEADAETVLAEVGVAFPDNPGALARWRGAGAEVAGDRVRLPRGLARALCGRAPARFTQIARDPERSVEIGPDTLVLAPVYGPPFVRDARGRRYGTMEDFRDLVRLGHMSPWLHHSGGTLCEPTDLPVATRHLDMLMAHATLTDRPFMGSVTDPSRARDSVGLCEALHGPLGGRTALVSLINVNSPLTFDAVMAGALEVYAEANQACIVSPFIVGGAMAPVTVAGTLVQVLAEVMAGVAYSQLVRPGAPVVFGAFVASIDMRSGAPAFGTPEASQVLMGAGQLARRMGLPFRSGGALTGAKLPDAQAAYESANTLQAALMGGVNLMLHGCGWLEGGLVASREKFVLDADQLGAVCRLAGAIDVSEGARALEAIRDVGPGGHHLGTDHTRARHEAAFWRSDVADHRTFEAWQEAGGPDAAALAGARARRLLDAHEPPPLDPGTAEALEAFVAHRREAIAGEAAPA